MPLLSMMSSERATYLPTLSLFPKGDMLNSRRTMVCVTPFLLCPTPRSVKPSHPPTLPAPRRGLARYSPARPGRSFVTRPAHRLPCNRLPGTRRVPFIDPHFGILHLAQQPEAVQRLPQHPASFLNIRFVAFCLLAQLTKPIDKRRELGVKNAFQILLHEARERRRHSTRADRDLRMT